MLQGPGEAVLLDRATLAYLFSQLDIHGSLIEEQFGLSYTFSFVPIGHTTSVLSCG